ncbi:MAG: M1 family aminopeptidase [Bryobacterales bacterium]|nr:M1 family aminopeptidase [Bryobacterales bacterium]
MRYRFLRQIVVLLAICGWMPLAKSTDQNSSPVQNASTAAAVQPEEPGAIAALAAQIREAGLDPNECYRVRDLDFTQEDARIYLTEGYLLFGKEVNGRRFSAVFVGEIDGGDAEILLFPPSRSERMSLAKFTESPNLNEHFRSAVFLFTDDTYAEILRIMEEKYAGRKVPEMGALYTEKYNGLVRNLSESLELRLVKDLSEGPSERQGFFYGTFNGSRLGAFDFILDSATHNRIRIGQFSVGTAPLFDTWTQFEPRSVASGQRAAPTPDYRVEHYDLDATLDRDLLLKVRTRVRLVPLSRRATLAFLISQNMRIASARAGDEVLEVYRPESMRLNTIRRDQDTALLVSMPKSAVVNEPIVIEMEHEGNVVQNSGNDVLFVGARGSWFPGVGNRLATYDVVFRVPKGMDFVSTWETVEQSSDATTTTYRASVKKSVRTFGFNVGKYKRTTVRKDDFVVNVFANTQVETALEPRNRMLIVPNPGPPVGRRGSAGMTVTSIPAPNPDPSRSLEALADNVVDLLTKLSAKFGPPAIRTVNVSPIPGHFGQGFAGMIYLSTISYLPETQRPLYVQDPASKTFYSSLLLPHELAHQWWGNLVFSDSDQDEWLMEGLANYTALLTLEEEKGKKEALTVLLRYRDNLLASLGEGRIVDDAGPILWGERLINSRDRGSWNTITYEKGTWIFHMLRARMGDDGFFRMLRELPRRFAYKPLSTAAFRRFAAEFVPPKSPDADLEEFFAQWVESTGIPRIEMTTTISGKAPKVTVSATLKQSAVAEEFGAQVPVVIRFARGAAETRWVRASNDGEDVEWTFRTPPSRVELDPDWLTLRRE